MTILFQNGTANGASPFFHESGGGSHVVTVTGDLDGATVTLQIRSKTDPNAEWVNVTNGSFTASDNKTVDFLPSGFEARGFISSVGASTDIFMEIGT